MTAATRHILRASVVLLALSLGLLGLVISQGSDAGAGDRMISPTEEPRLLTSVQADNYGYLSQGRGASGAGKGLFETDFFKPPPAPPPAPKPVPPSSRELVVFYQGLASFADGARVAYLSVDGRTLTLGAGEAVADGWTLSSFDSEQAALAKGEETLKLPFNRRVTLSVPVKP